MKKTISAIFLVCCIACNMNNSWQEETIHGKMGEKLPDSLIQLVVAGPEVIFLMPDSVEIKEMQQKYSEEVYSEIVADITWYPGVAAEILDSFSISYQFTAKPEIILLKQDSSVIRFDRKTIQADMILFHPEKDPLLGYAIEFDRDSTLNYFRN